jgi:hypothetical protein
MTRAVDMVTQAVSPESRAPSAADAQTAVENIKENKRSIFLISMAYVLCGLKGYGLMLHLARDMPGGGCIWF